MWHDMEHLHRGQITIRAWLKQHGYQDVLAIIDDAMKTWRAEGIKTRRNWWEILAGDQNGNPRTINGREFPVLKAAQLRQGVPVTPNAICRNDYELIQPIWQTKRWKK
jgi:hypothetical protein